MEKILKILFVLVAAILLVSSPFFKQPETEMNISTVETKQPQILAPATIFLKVPAVDNEGNGVVTTLKVQAQNGEGRVLTDVNNLLFWVDTQYSIRTAQRVAQNITKINISDVDLIYTIETNASLIEGPSAGAALTIATILALENKTINDSVMITGTIMSDGSVGPVGEVITKANAAKDVGATLFLVPKGQGLYTVTKPIETCEKFGFATFCSIEYKTEKVNIKEKAGIEVKEVSSIQEAIKYFVV